MTKKKAELSSGEQHKRFLDAAQELGCPDDADTFDEALKKIASAPPPKTVKKRKKKKPAR